LKLECSSFKIASCPAAISLKIASRLARNLAQSLISVRAC
jgi:hypothetical protein